MPETFNPGVAGSTPSWLTRRKTRLRTVSLCWVFLSFRITPFCFLFQFSNLVLIKRNPGMEIHPEEPRVEDTALPKVFFYRQIEEPGSKREEALCVEEKRVPTNLELLCILRFFCGCCVSSAWLCR